MCEAVHIYIYKVVGRYLCVYENCSNGPVAGSVDCCAAVPFTLCIKLPKPYCIGCCIYVLGLDRVAECCVHCTYVSCVQRDVHIFVRSV